MELKLIETQVQQKMIYASHCIHFFPVINVHYTYQNVFQLADSEITTEVHKKAVLKTYKSEVPLNRKTANLNVHNVEGGYNTLPTYPDSKKTMFLFSSSLYFAKDSAGLLSKLQQFFGVIFSILQNF